MATSVLVVEDEKSVADLLKERLASEGYEVKIAYSGADALRSLCKKNSRIDIVTLDIFLPDVNGLYILKDLKSDPQTYKIPVIVISSSDEVQNAKKLGADEFIPKPINFKKLYEILKSVKENIKNKIA